MFKFRGRYYKFVCLPFGLRSCPYVYTKISKSVSRELRARGFRSVIYLDDWLCIGCNLEECMKNGLATVELLQKLGFVVNFKKVVFIQIESISNSSISRIILVIVNIWELL